VGDLLDAEQLNAFCEPILKYVYNSIRRSTPGASVVVDQTPENLEFAEWILELSSIFSWLQLEFDDAAVETALQNCSMRKLRQASVAPPTFLRKGMAGGWQDEVSAGQQACVEYNRASIHGSL
jgi:hypothetical protein